MQFDFQDGSYISFDIINGNLRISAAGKKQDGTYTQSSSFLNKGQALSVIKFLLEWLDE